MNWAPYAVYNPQLWHWPETWPLVSLSPTVEPFIVIGYATFYMAPFFPAIWILRRLQARAPPESFVWRHPLRQPGGADPRHRLRVRRLPRDLPRPHPAVHLLAGRSRSGRSPPGEPHQFPLIWESALVTLVMIPAGVLLLPRRHGPDAGREAGAAGALLPRPAGAGHVPRDVRHHERRLLRLRRRLRRSSAPRRRRPSVACPWPYPEAKVYDPNGFYEEAGQPGPFFPGIWAGWQSAQSGRPDVDPPADGGRCGERPAGEPARVAVPSATLGRAAQHAVAARRRAASGPIVRMMFSCIHSGSNSDQARTSAEGPSMRSSPARTPLGQQRPAAARAGPGSSARGRRCSAATRGARRAGCCTRR